MNPVSDTGDHCAAGHESVPPGAKDGNHLHACDTTKCYCEAFSASKTLDFETEELATSTHPHSEIWVEWHQGRETKFDDAEFYALGSVASVHCGDEIIEVENEGDRNWERESGLTFPAVSVRKPEEFCERFPDGKLPVDGEDGWAVINNGWFALYQPGLSDPVTDDVFFSLEEAVEYAKNMLDAYAEAASGPAE
jgi:hypothetical protein